MAWSNEEILKFQMSNNQKLVELNSTLKGCTGKLKVGIFCPGQSGDCGTAMSVLKYKDAIFPDKDIIWFANFPVADMLRYSLEVNEVRPWPWAGNGLPEGTPDFYPLLCKENNKLNLELASQYELTKDLWDGYFPCPYMLDPIKRHGWDYPNCSRKVFGVPDHLPWHPNLGYGDEESTKVKWYLSQLPKGRNVLFETFAGSSQSSLTDEMVHKSISICKEKWPDCNIIFTSHKYLRQHEDFPENFFEQDGIYSAADFTVRQFILFPFYCKLLISVSSGISVACSSWHSTPIPTIQYCGSWICSTQSLSKGTFELVTADNKSKHEAESEFYDRLEKLLIQHYE